MIIPFLWIMIERWPTDIRVAIVICNYFKRDIFFKILQFSKGFSKQSKYFTDMPLIFSHSVKCLKHRLFTSLCSSLRLNYWYFYPRQIVMDYQQIPLNWPNILMHVFHFLKFLCGDLTWRQDTTSSTSTITNTNVLLH